MRHSCEAFGLDIQECEWVYKPAEDTFLMLEVLDTFELEGKRVLDMGCGTGALGIFCSLQGAKVTQADINEQAIACTQANAARNGVVTKIIQSDLFENVPGPFNIILFNGPYLPADGDSSDPMDQALVGGVSGTEIYERFLEEAVSRVGMKGKVLIVTSSLARNDEFNKWMFDHGLGSSIVKSHRVFFEDMFIIEVGKSIHSDNPIE